MQMLSGTISVSALLVSSKSEEGDTKVANSKRNSAEDACEKGGKWKDRDRCWCFLFFYQIINMRRHWSRDDLVGVA